nr:hypothetical protein [Tanacetum cinerariifolium]
MSRQCTQPKRPRNASWYKDKAMLAKAQEAGQILDEEKLVFPADPRVPDGQAVQTIILNNAVFQTEDLDTYDSNCDDISNAKAVLMANISNYGYDVISEVPHSETYLNDMENQSVLAMQDFKQPPAVDFTDNEIHSDRNIIIESKEKEDKYMENEIDLEKQIKELDNILFKVSQSAQIMYMLTKPQAFYDNIHKQALGYQNPFHIKKAQRIKPTFYNGIVMSDKHVAMPVTNDNETLILEEESRLRILKNLKFNLAKFNNVVKIRTTPNACTKGKWGFEHTKAVFNNEIIPFLKPLKDIFNVFDGDLLNEIIEVQTIFDQMDAVVQQSLVDKQCLEIAKKELLLEND